MAPFNQQPNIQGVDNKTGYSRGIETTVKNDALGSLFSTVAEFGGKVVQAVDTNNQEVIRDEIYAGVDQIQGEVGVDDATLFQNETGAAGGQPLPSQVAAAGGELDRLESAYQAGALKESHYWARLNSMVRQLRQKYPGYREEIDQMVSSVTGANPANALRSSLFDEWGRTNAADKQYSDLVEWAAKSGHLPADFDKRSAENDPYTYNNLLSHVSARTRDEQDRTTRRSAMAEMADSDTMTGRVATRNFTQEASTIVKTTLGDMNSVVGRNFAQAQKAYSDLVQRQATGTDPAQWSADVEFLKARMNEVTTSLRTSLMAQASESWDGNPNNTYSQYMTLEEINNAVTLAMAPVEQINQAMANEQFGLMKGFGAWVDAQTNEATAHLIENVVDWPLLMAAKDTIGDNGVNWTLGVASPEYKESFLQAMNTWTVADRYGNPGATVKGQLDFVEKNDLPAEFVQGSIIDSWKKTIDQLNKDVSIEQIQSDVNFMFGPENMDVLAKFDSNEDRVKYFKQVASPMVTKKMLELKGMGDTESFEKYQQWVTNNFMALFKDNVESVQASTGSLFADIQVTWDAQNTAFRLAGNVASTPMTMGIGIADLRRAQTDVQKINDIIRVVAPIIADAGGETGPEMYTFLQAMGFDPKRQGNIIDQMMAGILGVYGEDETPTDEVDD